MHVTFCGRVLSVRDGNIWVRPISTHRSCLNCSVYRWHVALQYLASMAAADPNTPQAAAALLCHVLAEVGAGQAVQTVCFVLNAAVDHLPLQHAWQ